MEKMKLRVKVIFDEEVLGMSSADPEIHKTYIASKAPDAKSTAEEVEALGMKSQFYHIVDGKVVCDYDKYHAWEEVVKLLDERNEKVRFLTETDYINSKLVDKLVDVETWEEAKTILSSDEYSDIRVQRQAARERINELDKLICVEKYLQYWKKEDLLSSKLK